ncbi:hypothetical protein [Nesterenkonia suensis]
MTSPLNPFTVCLPIDDRRRAMDFCRDAFGFEPAGPLAVVGLIRRAVMPSCHPVIGALAVTADSAVGCTSR